MRNNKLRKLKASIRAIWHEFNNPENLGHGCTACNVYDPLKLQRGPKAQPIRINNNIQKYKNSKL